MGPVDIPTTSSTGQNSRLAGTGLPERGEHREPLQHPASPRDTPGAHGCPFGPAVVSSGKSRRRAAAPANDRAERRSGAVVGAERQSIGGGRGWGDGTGTTGRAGVRGARQGQAASGAKSPTGAGGASAGRNTVRAGRTPEAAPHAGPPPSDPREGSEKGPVSGPERSRRKRTSGLEARPHLRCRRGPRHRPSAGC